MPSYPSFLLPADSVKIRFSEPYASQALNMKTGGIVPPGIYNGFTPNVDMATPNVLLLNTDPYRNDSVAVGDVYNLNGAIWTADYNLTIRTTLQIQLDFTGHTVFPVWVVLRPAYSIVAHPFSGLTNAQVVTINTLTVDDTDTFALHHGDVKICRINSIGPVVFVTAPNGPVDYSAPTTTNRNDNGGPVVTPSSLSASLVASLPFTKVASISIVNPIIDAPSQTYPNTEISFTTTVIQDVLMDLQINVSAMGDGGPEFALTLDFISVMFPGTDSSTRWRIGSAMGPSGASGCAKMLFPAVPPGNHKVRLKLITDTGPSLSSDYLGVVYYK